MRRDGKKPSGPVISVRWEVTEIGLAVSAARLLLEELSADNHGDVPLVRDAARAARAVLSLVEARLKLLDQGIGGEVDPRLLVGRHNVLHEAPAEDEKDFFLRQRGSGRPRQLAGRRSR